MPPKEWKLRIGDILDSISAIQDYVQGISEEDFCKDRKTVDAVVRNFITIGEAVANVPSDVTQAHPEIPWRQCGICGT